jgi:hypothetical protein
MKIAVLGWGSLIWCPSSLRIKTRWRANGPMLPIEFARISEDGRLTLVIHPGSALQQIYWTISDLPELKAARENLKEREHCSLSAIHYHPCENRGQPIPSEVTTQLHNWLQEHKDIHAVIWTGLETNWSEKFPEVPFSPENAVRYLDKLDAERKRTKLAYERAKEYLTNAPPAVQTKVRNLMREKGWLDAKLADVLFEINGEN